jgi:hypothetical protein
LNRLKLPHFELAGDFQKLEKEFKTGWGHKVTATFGEMERRYEPWISVIIYWSHRSKILFILTAPFVYVL